MANESQSPTASPQSTPKDQSPQVPFHPSPGIGHELGIMFGFMAVFVFAMTVYLILFKAANRRSEKQELARREALAQKGFGGEKSGLFVKGDDAAITMPHSKEVEGGDGDMVIDRASR